MSASHHRSHSGQHQGGTAHMLAWEKQVLLGLMRVCMDSSTGQSSIDALRDALITGYPQVLPEMKHKYGKFTAFLKANEAYFQINPFDRTVRLNAVHPDLISPITMPPERTHSPMVPESSSSTSTSYSTSSSGRDATTYNDKSYSSSSGASLAATSRSRPTYTQPMNVSTSPDIGVSPRSHLGTVGRRANFSTAHAPSASSSAGSLASSNPSVAQPSNPAPKHVSFSSLEQWEQMTVFAVLKYLLHTPNGIEHYTTLQERLNDPQLMSKYASLVDLLRLFPGNFLIDSFGYVSLADPAKARLQYPTLAAEFERRISTPPAPAADATNHLTVAFNNATSPWEKALLKTVWTILMAQTNHAANFPWLTTQLTRFKPWVKQNFGSLRLWAIQQTLFKFQGDTIYVPAHVAPSSSASGLSSATAGLNSNSVPGPPPPMPPTHRATTATSSFAPVSSANFSIPVPPALPQRRTSNGPAQNPPPVPPPATKPHSTFAKWNDQQPAWGPVPDDRSRGRPQSSAPPGHKRQRSASPSSLRASGIPAAPSAHHRSQSSAADDMAMVIPVRFGYAPPPASTVTNSATAPSVINASSAAVPMNIPKLNFPNANSNPPSASASHPFLRKTSASVENNRTSHAEATSPSTTTGPSPLNGKERETVVLAAQAVSPRRLTPNPLYSIDKDIPNLSQVPLVVNRAGVAVKVVQTTEEVRKMVQFLSTFSCISVAAEIGEFESQVSSARRSRMSTEMIHSPTDDTSQSATSVIIASSPTGDYPETPTLVIGSAPSHATPNPLESHVASNNLSQDDSVLNRHRNTMSSNERMTSATQTNADNHQIAIIHEDREEKEYSNTTLDIAILCFSVRTSHGNSPHAPSSTLAGHSDKDLYKSHPVFVLDLHANPKFYRYIRGLLRSTSTLKVVYDCPKLADILHTQHGIHLANIIEVQVVHRLLWEISTLPQRFTNATGLETSLTQSEEIAKSSDSSHGAKMSSGAANLSDSSGSASKVAPGSTDSISGILARSSSNSSRSPSKPPSDKQNSTQSASASSHQYHATLHPVHALGATHLSATHHATQPPIPPMDATYGQLLQYFGITLGGLSVPEKHPLLDAVEHNISGASIRTALWPAFSISPPALLRIIAVAATLIDLRILLATQLAVSLSKSALQLSQGFSHTHLPEFQNGEASGTTLTPLSHDQWMDAPELFSHLNE